MGALLHGESSRERVSDRAFKVLGVLRDMGAGPHALRSIVSRSGLSRSTVQRLIQSGMRNGVIRQPRHGYYALAGNRDEAGFSPRQWIPASGTALRAMGIVAEESGHTAGLHAAVLTDVPVQVCVGCVDNPGGIPQEASLGIPRRLGEDAAGQAILAYLDLPHPRPGERAAVRLRGWAASSGPVSGSQMVAVPILRFGVPVGAVSLTAPADTMPSSGVPAGVRALKRAAGLLQRGAGRSCA